MELEKLIEKSLVKKTCFSARVFVVGAILTFIFFLLLVDSLKTYHSEISILINAKSDVAVRQQSQIVASLAELPGTLAFYDRLLKLNPTVRDVAAKQTAEQRKEEWNKMFSVERTAVDASVLKLEIAASRQADAEQLAAKTVRTFFDTAALYYDVKKDVDLRIIDGPITRVQLPNLLFIFVLALLAGFGVARILQVLIFDNQKLSFEKPAFLKKSPIFDFKKTPKISIEDELESLNKLYQNDQTEQPFEFEQGTPAAIPTFEEKFQEIKKITKQLEPDKYPNFPEMPARNASHIDADGPVRTAQKASAPDNLPIADDTFLDENVFNLDQEKNEQPSAPTQIEESLVDQAPKEPTPEELKKRLNQLLRGEI